MSGLEVNEEEQKKAIVTEKVNKLKSSKFKQQMLPAWRPVPSYGSTMTIFIVFGIVFLTLGIIMFVMSDKIQQIEVPYSSECAGQAQCDLSFKVDTKIEGPLYVYYELDNFYQNHRRYVKSRSYDQLMGKDIDLDKAEKDCDPIVKNKDGPWTTAFDGTTTLTADAVAFPCGLIAKSVFTDKYTLSKRADFTPSIPIDQTDIAWKSDREFKFKNQEGNWQAKQWTDVTDEHFIVWMRTAGLPQFRKLWGKLANGLDAGTYHVRIANTYDVSGFNGSKKLVMSTTNILGGQNYFLAIAYIVVGGLCLVLAIIFFGVYMSSGRDKQRRMPSQTNN